MPTGIPRSANVLQAQANTQTAEINLGYTTVSAPFDGVVTARKVSIGELVGGDQPSELATIVQLDPIWVWFNLSERDVQRVRATLAERGMNIAELVNKVPIEVGLQTESGYPHKGVLDYADPQRQPVDRHDAGARRLPECGQGSCCRAISFGCGCRCARRRGCWCRRSRSAAIRPAATCSRSTPTTWSSSAGFSSASPSASMRVVESGLKPDERVVVAGIQDAIPGQKVDPQLEAPKSAALEPADKPK